MLKERESLQSKESLEQLRKWRQELKEQRERSKTLSGVVQAVTPPLHLPQEKDKSEEKRQAVAKEEKAMAKKEGQQQMKKPSPIVTAEIKTRSKKEGLSWKNMKAVAMVQKQEAHHRKEKSWAGHEVDASFISLARKKASSKES